MNYVSQMWNWKSGTQIHGPSLVHISDIELPPDDHIVSPARGLTSAEKYRVPFVGDRARADGRGVPKGRAILWRLPPRSRANEGIVIRTRLIVADDFACPITDGGVITTVAISDAGSDASAGT